MITDDVNKYKNRETVRFHMPGHKGRALGAFFDEALPYDVTELPETDDLYRPLNGGGVEESEKRAAKLFGANVTIYSAGGATLAVQAAIMAVRRRRSGEYLCSRNVHMSMINALGLCGVQPRWFDGIEEARNAAQTSGSIAAVIFTYESYYGYLTDIREYFGVFGDAVFIIDNAHGSHLAFDGEGLHPLHIFNARRDKSAEALIIDSPHKTLPAMTGCALLHGTGGFGRDELKDAMSVFGSTSPSYLLLQSLDKCIAFCDAHRDEFARLNRRVGNAKERLRDFGYTIAGTEKASNGDTAGYALYDPARICISAENADEIFECFRAEGVIPEFCDGRSIVFIPSIMNGDNDFERLTSAAEKLRPKPCEPLQKDKYTSIVRINIRDAMLSSSVVLPLKDCVDMVSARMIAPYPPGVPVIMPGEVITGEIIQILIKRGVEEAAVISD